MFIKGGINHITLRVRNLKRSEAFYSNVLGLKKVGSRSGMDFYSSGHFNHELALAEDPNFTEASDNGLQHFAFNISNKEDLAKLKQTLSKNGYFVSAGVDHIIAHSFYTQDPDGYYIELTIDQPKSDWSDNPMKFRADYILD